MNREAISVLNDIQYAHSNDYLTKLNACEFLLEYGNENERKQCRDEYASLVLQYGGRTKLSWELEQRLAKQKENGILQTKAPNLDNGIPQAQVTDTPCTEGDTDMAKQLKERVEVGRDENDNPIYKWATGYNRQEILQSAARLLQPDKNLNTGSITVPIFSKWLDEYNTTFRKMLCPTTRHNYAQLIRKHINPRIGNMKLTEIDSGVIQRWFDDLCEDGKSEETIMKIRTIIKPAFDYAVDEGKMQHNPISKRTKINTKKGKHHKALPLEQSQEIKRRLNELTGRERIMAALLCYTGQRIGEVLGLRWEDIDFARKEIHLVRGITHPTRNQPVVGGPKTENSIRIIPLAEQLITILTPIQANGYVVSGEKPLTFQQQKRSWEKIAKHFHIEGYTAHDMRDTCATEWFEMGIPIVVVSKMLGHASIEITMRLYAKVRNKSTDEARATMDRFYDKAIACDNQCDNARAS